jgi:hypothetical protein
MSEIEPKRKITIIGADKKIPNPVPQFGLPEASSGLIRLTSGLARPTLLEAKLNGSPYNELRFQRRTRVHERLTRLYNFFEDIDGEAPTSQNQALIRYETLLDLLVHPNVDEAMTEAVNTIQLPKNSIIALFGSSASGAAQIRTLAARDRGFDPDTNSDVLAKPDVDTILLSEYPISRAQREEYKKELDPVLERHNLRSCPSHNIRFPSFTFPETEDHLQQGDLSNGLKGLIFVFDQAYPKNLATQMRVSILAQLTLMSERDPQRHTRILENLMIQRRSNIKLSRKHFDYDIPREREEEIEDIRDYFRDRITGVFGDMLDTTRAA